MKRTQSPKTSVAVKILKTIAAACVFSWFIPTSLIASSDYGELHQMFSEGKYTKLISLGTAAIKDDPTDINAFYFLGLTYRKLNLKEQATESFLQFDRLHDDLEQERKNEEKFTGEYLMIDAWYAPAYYILGEYYFHQKNYAKAERHLRRALSQYYDDPMVNFYLGITLMELKNYDSARKYFKRMMELDPRDSSPWYNMACSYAREGNSKGAMEWLRKAIERYPKFKEEAVSDHDFDVLKKSPEFQKVVKQ